MHLKSQKRKIKEKNKSQSDKPPFFDVSYLKSVTIRIIAVSAGVSSLGMNTPLIYLVINHVILSNDNNLLLAGYPGTD